ncbi:hypothetical protein [Pedobacter sp.]|uniref:hypothetical protein n=1 Tax=Pedobacter sp. TaxID=1411316 RepID=UPI003C456418
MMIVNFGAQSQSNPQPGPDKLWTRLTSKKLALPLQEEPIFYPEISRNNKYEFLRTIGISKVVLSTYHDLEPMEYLCEQLLPYGAQKWQFFNIDAIIKVFQDFFSKCVRIELDEVSDIIRYSDFWQGMLEHVFYPMGERGLAFVFHIDNGQISQPLVREEYMRLIDFFFKCGSITLKKRKSHFLSSNNPLRKSFTIHPHPPA